MHSTLTSRLCLCCGKRSVWKLILVTPEATYRVFYCMACDLIPDPKED